MKTVILAGGLGTRLQPFTTFLPKSMLPLGEKPLLEHLIDWNRKNGVKDIVLCVSYLRRTIENYFEDGKKFGVNIEYAISNRPLATAGQLKTAEEYIKDTFVCMYGDSIYNFSLRNMIKEHKKRKAFITMGLFEYKTNLPYGVIETTRNGRVSAWNEKPELTAKINMGCYVMEPEVMSWIPKNKPYGMNDVIKKAIARNKIVSSYLTKKGFIDIGNKTSYTKANQEFRQKLGNI